MRSIMYRSLVALLALSGSAMAQDATTVVPLGGNAYVTHPAPSADETIADDGLHNWDSSRPAPSSWPWSARSAAPATAR